MGVVYKARHRALEKEVAIKVLLPGMSVERFRREARLLAQLDSPYVVAVHDFDVLRGECPVLVMMWVEGHDLARILKERGGRLEEAEALPLMAQVAQGLAAAAERGIVHRDLKPSNILIDTKGRARVVDFGLARGPEGPGEVTLTLGALGTPYYMAPEQAEDPRNVDTRADIYSFGATFYHILTGSPPFVGETAFSTFFKAKTEPLVSPRARVPALSERTGELIERCLAKSPSARFGSFDEILRHVRPAVDTTSPWEDLEDPSIAALVARYQGRKPIYLKRRDLLDPPDVYTMTSGRRLIVTRGSIIRQEVDAVVSSDDEMLSMGGGVSGSLMYAAGPAMVAEAKKYIPVRAGRAVVTSAGRMPARFVFHGVTLDFSKQQYVLPSRDLILEIMASCFYHADTLNVRTIAFPLLGTGAGGFEIDVCLDTMFYHLARTLTRGVTSVQEATIVLFYQG
jgi:serine/threonine protein kinase